MTTIEVAPPSNEPFGKIRLSEKEVLDTNTAKTIVSLRNVHKTYLLGVEGVPALRGVSVSISRGEFVCIYGTSGGGKTTLLNVVGTIDRPTKGDIIICGTHVTPRTPDRVLARLRLQEFGFVFQTFNLLSALNARENVELPMVLLGRLGARERRKRAEELLDSVGLQQRYTHLPSQLSGGEQQRVTIARAMANNPSMLLLDEPTGDLDTHNTAVVMNLLLQLNKQRGITLVMVTHDINLKAFADRVIWMRDGLVQRIETADENKRVEVMSKMNAELLKKGFVPEVVATTELRKPNHYLPLRFAQQMMRAKQQQEEEARVKAALGIDSTDVSTTSSTTELATPPNNKVSHHQRHHSHRSHGGAAVAITVENDEGQEKKILVDVTPNSNDLLDQTTTTTTSTPITTTTTTATTTATTLKSSGVTPVTEEEEESAELEPAPKQPSLDDDDESSTANNTSSTSQSRSSKCDCESFTGSGSSHSETMSGTLSSAISTAHKSSRTSSSSYSSSSQSSSAISTDQTK